MKKHFEQAIAFDRDSPLNQRTGLGKKYNELIDEYNTLEEKYNKVVGTIPADGKQKTVSDGVTTKPVNVTSTKKSNKE